MPSNAFNSQYIRYAFEAIAMRVSPENAPAGLSLVGHETDPAG
jgi:hypothetical protein